MQKMFFGHWINIPCTSDNIGSCFYEDVCQLLPNADQPDNTPCPKVNVIFKPPFYSKQAPFFMQSKLAPHINNNTVFIYVIWYIYVHLYIKFNKTKEFYTHTKKTFEPR